MSEYRVDVHDDALMTARPWCWLRDLILGLLSADTRLARHFAPDELPEPQGVTSHR